MTLVADLSSEKKNFFFFDSIVKREEEIVHKMTIHRNGKKEE